MAASAQGTVARRIHTDQIIGEIRERANRRLWRKLASLPDSWQTAQLAGLLEIPEGQRVSVMEQLRKGPVTVSGPSLRKRWNVIPD